MIWKLITLFVIVITAFVVKTTPISDRVYIPSLYVPIQKDLKLDKCIILLTFNGYTPKESCWNRKRFSGSDLNAKSISSIKDSVSHYFSDYDVLITTSDTAFYKFPSNRRIRVVITSDVIFGNGGGISVYNALYFKDTTTCLVSTIALNYDTRAVGIAIAHEVGHTLGLAHQAIYKGAYMLQAYDLGDSLVGPIMGAPYWSKKVIWTKGTNDFGQYQDDDEIISKTFKKIK